MIMKGEDEGSSNLHLALNDKVLVGQVNTERTHTNVSGGADTLTRERVPYRKLQVGIASVLNTLFSDHIRNC